MNYTYVVCKKDQKSRLLAATEPQAFLLTVWRGDESLTFTGETESLCLKALRAWLNGGDEGADGLTLRDCPAPHDVALALDGSKDEWYVTWPGSSWHNPATGRCTSRRYFRERGEAVKAFLDACSCRVFPLSARCCCANCGREMVRAYAPWIPATGWVCYDCLTYYVGCPAND